MMPAKRLELPPVDLEHLHMFTRGDTVEEAELTVIFLQEAQEVLAILTTAQMRGDAELWKATAHRFKGASGNFGAMPLHYLCKEVEMSNESSAEIKQEMLGLMREELRRIQDFLKVPSE